MPVIVIVAFLHVCFQDMATPAVMKRETLKSLNNIPDWILQQRSKDKNAKSSRPHHTSSKYKGSTTPVALVVTPVISKQPIIKEEVKATPSENVTVSPSISKGEYNLCYSSFTFPPFHLSRNPHPSRYPTLFSNLYVSTVRRIYSREFLIKFKYSGSPFAPGTPTPQDLIAQYNKEYEVSFPHPKFPPAPLLTFSPHLPHSVPSHHIPLFPFSPTPSLRSHHILSQLLSSTRFLISFYSLDTGTLSPAGPLSGRKIHPGNHPRPPHPRLRLHPRPRPRQQRQAPTPQQRRWCA